MSIDKRESTMKYFALLTVLAASFAFAQSPARCALKSEKWTTPQDAVDNLNAMWKCEGSTTRASLDETKLVFHTQKFNLDAYQQMVTSEQSTHLLKKAGITAFVYTDDSQQKLTYNLTADSENQTATQAPSFPSSWELSDATKNALSGVVTIGAHVMASDYTGDPRNTPFLLLRKTGNKCELFAVVPYTVLEEVFHYRLDSGKIEISLGRSTDYGANVFPHKIIEKMRGASTLVYEYTPWQERARAVTFNVTGVPAEFADCK